MSCNQSKLTFKIERDSCRYHVSCDHDNVVSLHVARPVKEDGLQRVVGLVGHGLKVVEEGFKSGGFKKAPFRYFFIASLKIRYQH